jgi:hypothetical protein
MGDGRAGGRKDMAKLLFASRNFANAPNKTCENEERRPKVQVILVINSERHFLALICLSQEQAAFLSHFRYQSNVQLKIKGMQEVYRLFYLFVLRHYEWPETCITVIRDAISKVAYSQFFEQ